MSRHAWLAAALLITYGVPPSAAAQWVYRSPTAPRTAGGAVDASAPAPRTASGTVDLSGIWQTDIKFNANLAADLKLVVMLYETRTTFRQIFLDAHMLATDPQPTWMGYSTGKWEGDTLVVQTVGFNDKTWLDDAIDDPAYYTRPWTVTQEFTLTADGELIEYVGNESNLDVPHLVGK